MSAAVSNSAEVISRERARREALARQYGTYENYEAKKALLDHEAPLRKAFQEQVKQAADLQQDAEDLLETLGHRAPYWMNPLVLVALDLALIGSPEGSDEWEDDTAGRNPRSNAPIGVFYSDYTERGWPRSAGAPVRKVTRWEHQEILRRLRTGGLTKPGAEVATVGKTLAQMVEEDPPVPGWIVEGILREGGSAMVYGPSGIGKTWLTHTLMLLAAAGDGAGIYNPQTERWILKAGEHQGVKVCLIDGEMIPADIADRAKILCGALDLQIAGSVQDAEPLETEQLRLVPLEGGTEPEEAEKIVGAMQAEQDAEPERIEPTPAPEARAVDLDKIVVFPKADQDHRAEFVDLAGDSDEGARL